MRSLGDVKLHTIRVWRTRVSFGAGHSDVFGEHEISEKKKMAKEIPLFFFRVFTLHGLYV